jgi:hypothetical protein
MKQQKVIRLTVCLIGTMIILACNAVVQSTPTAVPTFTSLPPTAAPTAVPTDVPPTSTLAPSPSDEDILYQDDFSSNAHGWDTGTETTDGGSTEMNIVDGQYVINISAKSEYYGPVIFIPDFSVQDFIMSVDMTILDTNMKDTGDLWLAFDVRGIDNDYYSFEFFGGKSKLILAQENKDDVDIWDWVKSSALKLDKGVTNTFKFEVSGETFTFYANDKKISSATNATINKSGEIDFIIMLINANENLRIAIDNLSIQSIKK